MKNKNRQSVISNIQIKISTIILAMIVSAFIGSELQAQPAGFYHPADKDQDNQISLDELTAYAADWKAGKLEDPNALDRVTEAAVIWSSGGRYVFEGGSYVPSNREAEYIRQQLQRAPFDASQTLVKWSFDEGTFQWNAHSAGLTVCGPFSLEVGGEVVQHGFSAIVADEANELLHIHQTIFENGHWIKHNTACSLRDDIVRIEAVYTGELVELINQDLLRQSFSYNTQTREFFDIVNEPQLDELLAEFITAKPYADMGQMANESLFSGEMVPLTNFQVANGWGFFSATAACTVAATLSAWCISAAIDGVGATCCVGGVGPSVVVYIKCLEDLGRRPDA